MHRLYYGGNALNNNNRGVRRIGELLGKGSLGSRNRCHGRILCVDRRVMPCVASTLVQYAIAGRDSGTFIDGEFIPHD